MKAHHYISLHVFYSGIMHDRRIGGTNGLPLSTIGQSHDNPAAFVQEKKTYLTFYDIITRNLNVRYGECAMGKFLFPNEYYTSTYDIDFEQLYQLGYRGIMFDIDNTLVPHDAMSDERSRKLLEEIRRIGFSVCFVSNNGEARVANFVKELHVDGLQDPIYVYKAAKPKPNGYLQGVRKMRLRREQVVFIGDQLLTDIWGANNARLTCILVRPVAKDIKLQIILKRILEKPVLWLYLMKHRLKGPKK